MARPETLRSARALAVIRMLTGLLILVVGCGKLAIHRMGGIVPLPMASINWQSEFPTRLASWLASHSSGIRAAIVRDLLIPHGVFAAGTLAWLEVVVGVLLLVGLWVRISAGLAVLVLGVLAMVAQAGDGLSGGDHLFLMVLVVAMAVGRAGDSLGLDGWRTRRERDRSF